MYNPESPGPVSKHMARSMRGFTSRSRNDPISAQQWIPCILRNHRNDRAQEPLTDVQLQLHDQQRAHRPFQPPAHSERPYTSPLRSERPHMVEIGNLWNKNYGRTAGRCIQDRQFEFQCGMRARSWWNGTTRCISKPTPGVARMRSSAYG